MSLKDLQGQMLVLMDEIKGITAKPKMSNEDTARLEAISTEGTALRSQIEAVKRVEGLSDWAERSAGFLPLAGKSAPAEILGTRPAGTTTLTDTDRNVLINDEGEMIIPEEQFKAISTPAYRAAFRTYLRYGHQGGTKATEALKVLQEGADVSGGYLVPDDILNRLIAKEPAPRTVASKLTRIPTSRDAMTIPKVNYTTDNLYTSGMRVTWTGEVPASATTHRVTDPVFGQIRIPVYTAMMSLPLTNDMIEDSSYPIVQWCTNKFGETIDLLYENMALNGTGIAQPSGILVSPNAANNPAQVVSGAAAALTADGILNLLYSLPPQYDQNAVAVMNKLSTGKAISQLKDGNGRYLWGAGLLDSGLMSENIKNRTLQGYDICWNEFMPNVAANTFPIIFGDLTGYYLVTRVGFSIQVLRELYAETNQILLLGRIRFGGQVVEDWKIKAQKVSV